MSKSPISWLDTIKTIVVAAFLAVVIRSFVFEPFHIPSGSMVPSLLVGDYLFVTKYSYGYSRYSFPLSLPLFEGRLWGQAPERGDIVVFRLPLDTSSNYIKRIIGLPGDTVQVKQGRVIINGQVLDRVDLGIYGDNVEERVSQLWRENLPSGRSYKILEVSDRGYLDDTKPYRVPPDHYFVLGDNRDRSKDSRVETEIGFIPAQNLVGRASIVFFSLSPPAAFWQIWRWPYHVRTERLLMSING